MIGWSDAVTLIDWYDYTSLVWFVAHCSIWLCRLVTGRNKTAFIHSLIGEDIIQLARSENLPLVGQLT